jgi:hypothetical protein
MPEARDVTNRDLACVVQFSGNYANRCFDSNSTGANTVEMSKGCDKPDGAVATHSQVSDIIEEDNSGVGRQITR